LTEERKREHGSHTKVNILLTQQQYCSENRRNALALN
jgi:hypothetical protein